MPHLALVTGGSRGIGAAIVEAFKAKGVKVLAPARKELDLSSPESIGKYTAAHAGEPIDILVNNAGINELAAVEDWTPELWARMIQVNLNAPVFLTQFAAASMKKRGWGRIVNVSSVFSLVTREKRAAYSASKSGLNGLTRTTAVELAPHGVLVNAVAPGYVETALTFKNNTRAELDKILETVPVGRMAKPDELARLVAFLCSEENTYLTGQTLVADGGFSCR